jgi:hypothetical protein
MFTTRYGKTIVSCAVLAVCALLFTLVLTHAGPAKPRSAPRPDTQEEVTNEGIKPGNYATSINIHNPQPFRRPTVYMQGGWAWLYTDQYAANPGNPPLSFTLIEGGSVKMDCKDIGDLMSYVTTDIFIEGFLVIFAQEPLDVVGVYTAEPPPVTIPLPPSGTQTELPGIALEVVPVAPHRIFVPPGHWDGAHGDFYEYAAKFVCGNSYK